MDAAVAVAAGMLAAWFVWRFWRPATSFRWLVALGLALVDLTNGMRLQILLGPLALELIQAILQRRGFRSHSLSTNRDQGALSDNEAADCIHLGDEVPSGRPFDLTSADLEAHVFLPGTTRSGKTTTILTLAAEVLRLGWSVAIIDCKAGDLGTKAASLADRHHVPFWLVDPRHADSLGYDITAGDANAITNKLIGAFSYGDVEIYKNIAMAVLPVLIRALQAKGERITLDSIITHLDRGKLNKLGHELGEPHQSFIGQAIAGRSDDIGAGGLLGLRYRFQALQQGVFGEVFRKEPALDWDQALGAGMTYVGLSATGASEDVELMGRVVIQDLKQAGARRLQIHNGAPQMPPVLLVLDEFAALREATQIVDLLVQAAQARLYVVISTQFLPESFSLREACVGAGLFVCHRLTANAAKAIADEIGTRATDKVTVQMDEKGPTGIGSLRAVEEFRVHPNTLRDLPQGQAAIRSVASKRKRTAIVKIHREGSANGDSTIP